MILRSLLFTFSVSVATAAQPNVLFIAVDDLRPELACYGETHMVTPNIDTLASQGRLFRNHYVAVPTCGASRYALMSGFRPTAGTDDNGAFSQMPSSLPANPESWVDLLRRNGWHTVSLGKMTHEPDGYGWNSPGSYDIGRSSATNPDMRFSWDEILYGHDKWGAQRYPLFAYADGTGRVSGSSPAYEIGVDSSGNSLSDEAYPDGQMAQAAIEKLREFKDDGTRFCLAVGFHKPHLPFNAPKAYWDLYDPETLPAASPVSPPTGAESSTTTNSGEINAYTNKSDRDQLRHAYFACVSYVDAQVGKVLAELDTLGLADDTVVVFWGDHGWCLDDYGLIGKHKVLERSLEAPLIIRPQASYRADAYAGIQADGVVETIDIYPTIAELCGLAVPSGPDGSSLVPMIRNPYAPGKNHAYSRYGSLTTIRTSDWRLIQASGNYDLYDLSSYRYEVADVSGSNSATVTSLSADLSTQGQRSGTTYIGWANGNPLLTDPDADADKDSITNLLEYAFGTNALSAASKPDFTTATEDLTSLGYAANELVVKYVIDTTTDDLTVTPKASTDLAIWNSTLLEFLGATDLGGGKREFRYRVNSTSDRLFFRGEIFQQTAP